MKKAKAAVTITFCQNQDKQPVSNSNQKITKTFKENKTVLKMKNSKNLMRSAAMMNNNRLRSL